ncbi:MAG: ATP-binding domain-containing protein, partial [Methylococcaceae bacterium]
SMRYQRDSGIGYLSRAINAGHSGTIEGILVNPIFKDLHWWIIQPSRQAYIRGISHGFKDYLNVIKTGRPTAPTDTKTIEDWCRTILQAFSAYQVLCAVREGETGVNHINETIAYHLHTDNLIEASQGWYEGRPVMMTHNDYELGIMNGDVGITLNLPQENGSTTLKVIFQNADGSIKTLSPSRLSSVETVYAMTIHKSQGSEFDHVVLILPESSNTPIATRELLYTGVTRAKKELSVYYYDINDITSMVRKCIQRSGRLAALLNPTPD